MFNFIYKAVQIKPCFLYCVSLWCMCSSYQIYVVTRCMWPYIVIHYTCVTALHGAVSSDTEDTTDGDLGVSTPHTGNTSAQWDLVSLPVCLCYDDI